MILMEFTIIPLDKGPSLSAFVARMLDIVDTSGLDYRLTPMGTIVEGDWEALMELLNRCFEEAKPLSERLSINVKLDYRAGTTARLMQKLESVEKKLGRKLKTQ